MCTAFIIEELKRNSKDDKELLSVTLLDAKSAFDVVNTDHRIWSIAYQNATGAVK